MMEDTERPPRDELFKFNIKDVHSREKKIVFLGGRECIDTAKLWPETEHDSMWLTTKENSASVRH